jgi:MHS family proline/betaine transporter-like MFS transporter
MLITKKYTSIIAGFIGNVVEWYDFALYGYMAGILSKLFFPNENEAVSLIATYGVFAAGFIMRPFGSAVFGWLGDTIGRTKVMLISVVMMALPTFLLGCLPTFDTIGIAAPILLVLIRMIQGLSVGGEFSSSVTYLVETAPSDKRGLAGSWANTGSIFGMLLGSGIAAAVTSFFVMDIVIDWAWRIPFLFGGILGTISILLRRHLKKSEHFKRHHKEREETSPLLQAFTTNRKEMIQAVIFASAYGVMFYIPLVYLPEWLNKETGMKLDSALRLNTASTALLILLIPLSGWIGDKVIRRTKFIAISMIITALAAWPLYYWLTNGGLYAAIVVQVLLVVLISVPLGSAPAMFVELFPASDRLSGYSISYNVGLGVIGGSTPMIATWLIEITGFSTAPALYLTLMALTAFIVLFFMRDGSREKLR